jgi:hypothetical protein
MKFRKLRIAWSVAWGIASILLCVLWVRSYRWVDVIAVQQSSQRVVGIGSCNASIMIGASSDETFPLGTWLVEPNLKPVKYLPWFEASFHSVSSEIYVPDWPLIVLTASVAVAPWIRHLRWRFSLRTLLIATTLVAMVLGLIVWVQ